MAVYLLILKIKYVSFRENRHDLIEKYVRENINSG